MLHVGFQRYRRVGRALQPLKAGYPPFPDRPAGFENELFRLLFESAEIATFTPQERIKYEYDMTTERDIRNQIAFAEQKGMDIGKAEGIAEGRTLERQRIVEELRRQGIPEDVIQQAVEASKKG